MMAVVMSEPIHATAGRIKDVFAAFEGLKEEELVPQLIELYHPEVEFQDPIQVIRGRDPFIAANRRLIRRARSIRFVLQDVIETSDRIVLFWSFSYVPKFGPELRAEAVGHMQLRDGLIRYHRDYWDLASALLLKVPAIGPLYKKLLEAAA
jgi:ketosteroid isomerase-like protein